MAINTSNLRGSHLFVFGSVAKIVHEKCFEIGSRSCPLPGTIRADPKVNLWIEVEACQQTMTIAIVAIHDFTVPKMKGRPRHTPDFGGYCSMVWPSPLKDSVLGALCLIDGPEFLFRIDRILREPLLCRRRRRSSRHIIRDLLECPFASPRLFRTEITAYFPMMLWRHRV